MGSYLKLPQFPIKMSDEYSNSFDKESSGSAANNDPSALHKLKLSIDLLSVRNMSMAANVYLSYQLHLNEVHSFQSSPPTPVGQSKGQDVKLANTFASYEFSASKQ